MLQLAISATSKSYSPSSEWQHLSNRPEIHNFNNMAEVYEYLNENYGKSKRAPMYCDHDGKPIKVGWVIGFRSGDWSHSPVAKWIQQDWIELREVKSVELP